MQSKAATVAEYLDSLPEERRHAIGVVRDVVLANLPAGYTEGMGYGMIGYSVPHTLYPKGYHCDPKMPLPYAALGAQKNHMAIYLCTVYTDPEQDDWFRTEFLRAGKRLDMGKSCVRFKKLEDLPLEVIALAIARVQVKDYVARYEAVLATLKTGRNKK